MRKAVPFDRSSKTILVIEDDRDIAVAQRLALEVHGYKAFSANSGSEGLALAFEKSPDAILLDLGLPIMSGREVCERLRADERTAQIVIIIVSSRMASEVLEQPVDADIFFPKSNPTDKLIALLDYVLAQDRSVLTQSSARRLRIVSDTEGITEDDADEEMAGMEDILDPNDFLLDIEEGDLALRGRAIIRLSILRRRISTLLRDTPAQDVFWRNVYHNYIGGGESSTENYWGKYALLALALTRPTGEQNNALRSLAQNQTDWFRLSGTNPFLAMEVAREAKENDTQLYAVKALGHNRDTEAVELLTHLITRVHDTRLIAAALEALGLIGDKASLPMIIWALNHETAAVRYAAINALAFIGTEDAAKQIWQLLKSDDLATRIDAVRSLARSESRLNPHLAVWLLFALCSRERNETALYNTAQSLGQLNTERSERILQKLLTHPSAHVQEGARRALASLENLRLQSLW